MSTYKNLVKEILNKLFFKWPRGQQSVEISTEQLGYEVTNQMSVPKSEDIQERK